MVIKKNPISSDCKTVVNNVIQSLFGCSTWAIIIQVITSVLCSLYSVLYARQLGSFVEGGICFCGYGVWASAVVDGLSSP